jgi:hypothetical protein
MAQELSFEEIDAHIKGADLSKFQPGGTHHFTAADVTANSTGVLQSLCGIYHVIRPILVVLSKLPLIPAAWKAAITTFISLADSLCP